MFGVALFASGLTVLLVTWPMLRPARPAPEAWTVDPAPEAWSVDGATGARMVDPATRAVTVADAVPPADLRPSGRRPAPRHRRRGRRRAGRSGLLGRRVPAGDRAEVRGVGAATAATVPRQRRGGHGPDDTASGPGGQGVVDIGGTPSSGLPGTPPGGLPSGPQSGPPATVPVIGTTLAGTPYRGVAPVPDGPRQFP